MEEVNEAKRVLTARFEALPQDKKVELAKYYTASTPDRALIYIIKGAREQALKLLDYADYHGYGLGEMGYFVREASKEDTEECPELEQPYRRFVEAYMKFFEISNKI